MRPAIGAHVSRHRLPGRALELGAEVAQVFVGNPRGWAEPAADPAGDEALRVACADLALFVHAPYLINFGSPSAVTRARSAETLEFTLRRAGAIGARGVVLHAGSAVDGGWDDAMAQVQMTLPAVLDRAGGPRLLIEPTAGGGGALASDATSLHAYLDALGRDERIGVCLDTCHMHAAGHDLSTRTGFLRALRTYAQAAGRGAIGLVHVNDSRDPAGSKRDRHMALGRGTIGLESFGALFSAPSLRRVPLVVETAEADHAADIAALKALRDLS